MADIIKKFFAKKKNEFKRAGPGHRLNESTSSSQESRKQIVQKVRSEQDVCEESKIAAAAALARLNQKRENPSFNTSLAAIQAQVRKELENEKAQTSVTKAAPAEAVEEEEIPRNLATGGVYFKCPLISDEVLPRDEWKARIKEFLYAQLEEEKGLTAALIIHSCNSGQEKIEMCVNTLCKYLENIVTYPEEEKYRKIRMSNRAFQERVQCMEGSMELLDAAGFVQTSLPGPDGNEEQFMVFREDRLPSIDSLVTLIDALRSAEPIQLELDRGTRVLLPSQASRAIELPPAFFHLTPEQIKKEQQLRIEAVEKSQMLRTKAMREKDELREMKKYKFAIVRVRFPDGILLQGTFSVYERLGDVLEFVREHLEHGDLPFALITPTGHRLESGDSESTLLDLKLVPTSVLTFCWDQSVVEQINRTPNKDVFLKPEVMILVQELT